MNIIQTPFITPLIIATAVSFGLILYAWPKQENTGARPFILLMVSVTFWLIGYAFQISSVDLDTYLTWLNISYLGIVTVPVAWLLFALEYTGRSHLLTWRNIGLIFLEPAIIILSLFTNDYHQLFRHSMTLNVKNQLPLLEAVGGPMFWVHTAYSYLLLLSGIAILFVAFVRSPRLYRRQISLVLIGSLIPWVANIFFLFFSTSGSILDPTPFGFLGTGIMMSWALFGYSLIDIAPIARNNVVENLDAAMFVLDNNNRVVDINPAARRLLVQVEGQVIGQPAAELFKLWPHLVDKFGEKIQASKEVSFHDGEQERFYDLRISPLRNRRGLVNGRLIMLHDTTEHKKVAHALRLAKEAAESANRAKSAFLANMSHELRTPLSVIIGYAELLEELAANNEYAQFPDRLDKIKISANNLLTIISELLDLSKIEAGRMDLYETPCNIPDFIETVSDSITPLIYKNNNTLHVTIAPNVDSMITDELKLRQVLLNLLSNAAKFTENGRINLKVFSKYSEPSKGNGKEQLQLAFQVSDTGIGLTDEQIESLFVPFVQAELSTTKKFGGTGLGLSISHHLCNLMGGTIQVESSPKQGSTFTVCLPWQKEAEYKPVSHNS